MPSLPLVRQSYERIWLVTFVTDCCPGAWNHAPAAGCVQTSFARMGRGNCLLSSDGRFGPRMIMGEREWPTRDNWSAGPRSTTERCWRWLQGNRREAILRGLALEGALSAEQPRPRDPRFDAVLRAMDQLPARQRRTLRHMVMDEMPDEEIANAMEVSAEAVRSSRSRAIRALGVACKG